MTGSARRASALTAAGAATVDVDVGAVAWSGSGAVDRQPYTASVVSATERMVTGFLTATGRSLSARTPFAATNS
jgi:hypothetical protein